MSDYPQLDHCLHVTCCTSARVSSKLESALQRRECERKSERKRGEEDLYHVRYGDTHTITRSPDIRRRWAGAKRARGPRAKRPRRLCMRRAVWRLFDVARVSLAFRNCFCLHVLCVCQVAVCSTHLLAALFGGLHWGRRREIGGGVVVCWCNGGRRI